MLLAIDMGNTNIEFGLLDGEKVVFSERVSTDSGKTATEYAVMLHTIFEIRNINVSDIKGAIISSVVAPLTSIIRDAVKKVTGITAFIVGSGIKTGLKIKIDDPKSIGADLVVGGVAAMNLYGKPVIIIDMGTATTITAVNENNEFIGGAIIPGVVVSLNALSKNASLLPAINLAAPKKVIASATVECMQSGIVYGQAAMLDGMISRMKKELSPDAVVVATGGLAKLIVPYCESEITLDNDLMLKGLRIIYEKNSQ